ncbi:hypothetical protein [Fictibacillus barbaricus]|uniref:hypothetical protein n=1 Tax=Fictibacillus barbaricus TaxID=182136 RepID=UPI001662A56C|nr:hypothetical protein [Fictibacillus barbaricus]
MDKTIGFFLLFSINMLSHTIILGLIAAFFPMVLTVEGLFWIVGGSPIFVGFSI